MAGNDNIPPNLILTNGTMTGTATLTSNVVQKLGFYAVAIQCNYSGTPTGTFYVDVCLDYNVTAQSGGTWTTLPVAPTPAPSGAAGVSFIDIETAAAFYRVRYVNASGTGVLNVWGDGISL